MGGDVKEKESFPKEFMTKEEYNLWLCSLDGIGSKKLKKILHYFKKFQLFRHFLY